MRVPYMLLNTKEVVFRYKLRNLMTKFPNLLT